jgi:hypothetical protein
MKAGPVLLCWYAVRVFVGDAVDMVRTIWARRNLREQNLEFTKDFIAELEAQLREGCTCGSGGHPRHCARHPCAYEEHCRQLTIESQLDAWTDWAKGYGYGAEEADAARDAIGERLDRFTELGGLGGSGRRMT